jgi:hypothetical protein
MLLLKAQAVILYFKFPFKLEFKLSLIQVLADSGL